MTSQGKLYLPVQGKTYSLFADGGDPRRYFAEIRRLADMFLALHSDERKLLDLVRKAGQNSFAKGLKTSGSDVKTFRIRARDPQAVVVYITPEMFGTLKKLTARKEP